MGTALFGRNRKTVLRRARNIDATPRGKRCIARRAGESLFLLLLSLFFSLPAFAQEFTAKSLGDFGNVTVMEVTGNYDANQVDGTLNQAPREILAKEFFKTHKDEYDFLVFFSNFDFKMPEKNVVAFYLGIKNDVQGIGINRFDLTGQFGSQGKLQGIIDMGNLANVAADPTHPGFEQTLETLSHEMLHRWAAHVKFKDAHGQISDALLGEEKAHWSFLFDSGASVLYGSRWRDNKDGTFTSIGIRKYWSPLDLYLMGMIDKTQVPPMRLIENPNIDPERLPEDGATISGTARTVTIDDIIAAEGERIPSAATSQKNFKAAFIFIASPGTFTGAELPAIENIRNGWVTRVSILNDGKGIMQVAAAPKDDLPNNPGVTLPPFTPRTLPPDIDQAVSWLKGAQKGDGSWLDLPQTTARDTAEAVAALRNFPTAQTNQQAGIVWLNGIAPENTDYLARKIEALAGSVPDVGGLLTELLSRQNLDGGWGSNRNYASSATDTALALKALAAAGYGGQGVLSKAIGYLKTAQNGDGGWGDGESMVQPTSHVLTAFNRYRAAFLLDDRIASGKTFLLARQNADGGFGNSPSTPYDTAASLRVLTELNVSTDISNRAVNYLLNLQSSDGSWYGSPYQTALAVDAVWKATVDPDLSVKAADISFLPASVTVLPSQVAIHANIWNNGRTAVPQAKVALYDGLLSEANKVGEQLLAFPGSSPAAVTFPVTIADGNEHRFYLVVDPDGQVKESNELNNAALKVLSPQTTYDFEVRSSDLSVSADPVNAFQDVRISSKVTNHGTANAFNVQLRYRLNDPAGAVEIATTTVDIPAGATIQNQVTWTANRSGAHLPITVTADPFNTFAELSETNNQGSTTITVNPVTGPNLTVSYQGIVATPAPALERGNVNFSALVKNEGFSTASNIVVNFYRGVPGAGGVLLGIRTIPSLAAGGSATVSVDWTDIHESGEKIIYVQVDPDNLIPEIRKDDNNAFITLNILSLPDLVIGTDSIVFAPSAPKEGDVVLIPVTVQNKGGQAVSAAPVRVFEGTTVIGDQNVSIPGNSQGSVTFSYNTAGKTGPHSITVTIDPDNTIVEQSKDNNQAARTFGVQDANLWLTEPYISPNGDGIKESTQFFFRLSAPETVHLVVTDEKGKPVRAFSGSRFENTTGGNITWDGLDESGRVVLDGTYRITIRDPRNAVLGSLPVVVDNNRSPLAKAIGTPYLLESNLTCLLPDIFSWKWFPDESGILFRIDFPNPNAPEYPTGLYSMAPDGSDIVRLVPVEWSQRVDPLYDYYLQYDLSPNGENIALVLVKYNRKRGISELSQLWVMDREGKNLTLIDSYDLTQQYTPIQEIKWSPDNQRIAYTVNNNYFNDLWVIKSDGTGKTKIDGNGFIYFPMLRWAADGQKLVYSVQSFDSNSQFTNRVILSEISGGQQTLLTLANPLASLDLLSHQEVVLVEQTPFFFFGIQDIVWLIDANRNPIKISEGLINDQISIAPDRQSFAFVTAADQFSSASIHVSDSTGNVFLVNEIPAPDHSFEVSQFIGNIVWSPDSTKMAFVHINDCAFEEGTPCGPLPQSVVHEASWNLIDIKTGEKTSTKLNLFPDFFGNIFDLVTWLPDGVSILGTAPFSYIILDSETGETRVALPDISIPFPLEKERIVSPSGTHITYFRNVDPLSLCYGRGSVNIWAISSLLNMTAELQASKGKSAVALKGTAADLNFDHYRLEYADVKSPNLWNLINPPSEAPVTNDLFTSWVPPYEGTFYVRLTVSDKAGNVDATQKRVSWGIFSSVTNFYKSLDIFSPNGDGVKDMLELRYRVLEPAHLDFEIYNEKDQRVKRFLKDYVVPAEDHITWDGRDDFGGIVPDGKYRIKIFDYEFFVDVDNTLPDVHIELSGIRQDVRANALSVLLSGRAVDRKLKNWIVEYGEGANPQAWYEYKRGEDLLVKRDDGGRPILDPIEDDIIAGFRDDDIEWLLGKKFRLTAEDFAGNRITRMGDLLAEEVIFYKWDHSQFDIVEGLLQGKPGGLHQLGLRETIRTPLASVTVQYLDDRTWHDAATTVSPPVPDLEVPWDGSNLNPDLSYPVRIKAADVFGKIYLSNVALLGAGFFIESKCLPEGAGKLFVTNVAEELVLLKFQTTNPDGAWTDFKVLDTARGDIIPRGKFETAAPPTQGNPVPVRMVGVGITGKVYLSETVYPLLCGNIQLKLKVTYDEAPRCGLLSSGKVSLLAELKGNPDQLLTLTYYMNKPQGQEILRRIDLTRERWDGIEVDTATIAEGSYAVSAVLTYIKRGFPGSVFDANVVRVDRVFPTARITYPTPTLKLCPQKQTSAEGIWYGIPIEGLVTDVGSGVKKYELLYGLGEDPVVWAPAMTRGKGEKSLPIEGFSGNGSGGVLGVWDVTELTSLQGVVFSLRLRVVDEAGNVFCYTTKVTIAPLVEIKDLRVDKFLFSPNGDGVLDDVTISYDIDEYAVLDVKVFKAIKDASGRYLLDSNGNYTFDSTPIRTIVSGLQHLGGGEVETWDGKSDGGAVVPDGRYNIIVSATDACGNIRVRSLLVEVDNTPPSLTLSYPNAGDRLGNVVEIRGMANDLHFQNYVLEAGEGSHPDVWFLIAARTAPLTEEGILGKWDISGLNDTWTFRLTATDRLANRSQRASTLNLGIRQNLITGLSVNPGIFSPNHDGKLDEATVLFRLSDPSDVKIEFIDSANRVAKNYRVTVTQAGPVTFVWDGKDDGGAVVPDGDYRIRVTAALLSNPSFTQAETITVTVDATPPLIDLAQPLDHSYSKTDVAVNGTISDRHLQDYTFSYTGETGGAVTLDQANQSRENYPFGVLHDAPEGNYTLHIVAADQAQNTTDKTIAFTIDRTPPKSTLDSPKEGEVYGGSHPTVNVTGALVEKNLESFHLRFGAGEAPTVWTDLLTGGSVPTAPALFTWKVGKNDGIPDGLYTLSYYAKDKAGSEGEVKVKVTIDNTLPEVSITSLQEGGYVRGAIDLNGTASDQNLDHYTIELSEGVCQSAFKWATLKRGTASISAGLLERWEALPEDGRYCLRLTAVDKVENKAEVKLNFTIDTHPPAAPTLAGKAENKTDAKLSWTPNTEPDLAGYHLYRNGQKVNTALLQTTDYGDLNLAEGTQTYTVKAVDRAGWESAASNAIKITVDLTGPDVKIRSPQDGTKVSGLIEIKGTAYSRDDFKQYRVYVGQGPAPSVWTLIRTSPLPTPFGTLTPWETFTASEGIYAIKVEGEDLLGNISSHQVVVTVDNTPPAAPHLISATPNGSDVTLTWQANSEADLAGYLLYRNNQLANVSGIVVGNLKPYLIAGTTYLDATVPDGTFTYSVVAMDQAGNVGDPSNTVAVTLDTHPPHAVIVRPTGGTRFELPQVVQADSPDLDIASIQYQYKKPAETNWLNLGSAVTTAPRVTQLDPTALALTYGDYQLRAVATDKGGKADPSPSPVTVTYFDLTPPRIPSGLTALEKGEEIVLSWTANTEGDLDGYNVFRTVDGFREKINSAVVKGATYTDHALSDGEYFYEITAVDIYGNESGFSMGASAKIYVPTLAQPYTPIGQGTIPIAGEKAAPNAQVALFNTTSFGTASVGEVSADATGHFGFANLILALGENRITAQATDAAGNVSRAAEMIVVVYNIAPSTPTGLAASVVNHDVGLTWNPNNETDLAGYNLYRKGIKVNQPEAVTTDEVAAITASSFYYFAPPSLAFDGDPESIWTSVYRNGTFDPVDWEIDLSAPALVDHFEIHWGTEADDQGNEVLYAGKDFEVQLWSGYAWITQLKVTGNSAKENRFDFSPAYRTDKIRIHITDTTDPNLSKQVWISEVGLLRDRLIAQASYQDLSLHDGRYGYTVSAVDLYGFESAPSDSVSTIVGDVVAPSAPTGLSASVSGSDVTVQWNSSNDADLVGYLLYRNNGNGLWIKAGDSPIVGTTFLDPLLQNGSYRYRLTAVDAAGNESDPSAEATATVRAPLPPAPAQLSVAAPPEGGILNLTWISGDPAKVIAGYHLFRSTAGGPYLRITSSPIAVTAYHDSGLVNGAVYDYQVRAVDSAGNLSDPSNEASGIPRDTIAPVAPIILYPTDAAHPRTVTTDTISVAGTADLGTSVDLLIDGILVDTAPVITAPVAERAPLPARPDGSVTFFGGESLFAFFSTPPGGVDRALTTTDAVSRVTRRFSTIINGNNPQFSPDGTKIAYISYENVDRLVLFDRAGGTISQVIDLPASPASFSFSPNGSKIALGLYGQLSILDLATGEMTPLASETAYDPVWSPDGTRIVYLTFAFGTTVLRVTDTAGTVKYDLDSNVVFAPAVFSPDGTTVLYTSFTGPDLRYYNLATDESDALFSPGIRFNPLFSPDGASLVYFEQEANGSMSLRLKRKFSDGSIVLVRDFQINPISWSGDGALVYQDGLDLVRILLPGHFQFNGIPLDIGQNVLTAVAVDPSGNESPPSEPVVVTLDTSDRADLALGDADLFVYPLFPLTGEPVRLAATVRNLGQIPAQGIDVGFFRVDSRGVFSQIGPLQTIAALAPGAGATASVEWPTAGLSGRYSVTAIADPLEKVEEVFESNNRATKEVVITQAGSPAVLVTTDQASYPPAGTVQISVEAVNPSLSDDFILDLFVEDAAGSGGPALLHETLSAFGYTSRTFTASWPAAGALSGSYRVHAVLTRSSGERFEGATPFTLLADQNVSAKIVTDRATYRRGEAVQITETIQNRSLNGDLNGLTTLTQILDAQGAERFRSERSLGALLLGTRVDLLERWTASEPGRYTARFAVRSAGEEIASASAPFDLVGAAVLEGHLKVVPAVVPLGGGFAFSIDAANSGTADASGVNLRLLLIDPDRQAVIRTFERVVNLPAGQSVNWDLSDSAVGLGPKSYTVSLHADQGNGSVTLASGTVAVVDRQAPVIEILSPVSGSYTNRDLSLVAHVTDDASGVDRVEYQINGGPWTPMAPADPAAGRYAALYPANPATEGLRTVTIRAFDKAGNGDQTSSSDLNPVSIRFVVDVTPPQIDITGVADGAFIDHTVTPVIQVSDPNLSEATLLLDGVPFISGTALTAEKSYLLEIRAKDLAGNTAGRTIRFALDKTPPAISVTGVEEGKAYNTDRAPGVVVTDPNLTSSAVTLNGQAYLSGTPITTEGEYTLSVTATDQAGNSAQRGVHFVIDKTAPSIAIAGVSGGEYAKINLTPVVTVSDSHLTSSVVLLDGAPFVGGTVLSAEKSYLLQVTAQDSAGNSSQAAVHFTIDKTPPVITVGGVEDGKGYNTDLAPSIAVVDANLDTVQTTLNGQPYLSGATISAEGSYTLLIAANDKAGNSAQKSLTFFIDRTPPTIAIDGVSEGQYANVNLTPTISITDLHLTASSILLDGAPYVGGTTLTAEKGYLLEVSAQDGAGNSSRKSVHFTIDKTPPAISIAGVVEGQAYRNDVAATITITDPNLDSSTVTLNGRPYLSGTLITAEADYTLSVTATDKAGNSAQKSIHFILDKTPPAIAVSGVADGQYAKTNLTPVVTVSDLHLTSSTILLDGAPFVSGTTLSAEKSYLLQVNAQDAAANNSQTAVHFTIDKTPPVITVSGVADGATYTTAVTPTITVTDASPVSQTISLNGAPFVSGTPVSADGQYTLQVDAIDPAGNVAGRTVHFTIAQNRPPTANAGADQNVIVGQLVTLDGTASSDPDGDQITYHWTVIQVPSGSAIATSSLSSPTGPKPTFTPDQVGTYLIELIVNDGKTNSAVDQVAIQAQLPPNVPPNANAGPDQNVLVGSLVLLSGAGSSDPDHGPQPLTYTWSFVTIPTGSTLNDTKIAGRYTVNANFVPDVAGVYTVRLTVSDGSSPAIDDVKITSATNTPPVADAGPDISIKLKQTANLDGSKSYDPDLRPSPLTYLWSFVSKPSYSKLANANIQNRTQAKASFVPDVRGTYVLSLTVNDGASSSTDNVAVTVRPVHIYGDGDFDHDGSHEKLSCDLRDQSGVVDPSSWLKYSYAKLNLNAVATQLSSIDVNGKTATITGTFSVNGASGYRFVATITDGSPDVFGIVIYRPNGTLLYQYSHAVSLGNLIIEE